MTTAEIVIALAPVASRLIIDLGGRLIEINTADLTREDLVAALEKSKGASWPDLKFLSTADPETAS
jgi:hypothetical protein